jgi:folylpolyglutamate synthase/dihydrofolate synthase
MGSGLYTSPHLCAVRERIRINGEPISEEVFAKHFFEVWERLEANPKVGQASCVGAGSSLFASSGSSPRRLVASCLLTGQTLTEHTPVFPIYFRLLTLLAFHTFLSLGVDATVLEVGIGGLYDSTNIVPKPVVTGVTSLGLDHTAVLGNTIEEIARNKAGIYKPGVPALSVVQEQVSGGEVLRSVAEKVGAPFEVVPTIPETALGLKGAHQRINASLAVALAKGFLKTRGEIHDEVLPDSFKGPLERTRWPGRCQKVEQGDTTWLLDGAHTTESLRSCGEWAWKEAAPNVLIFNCSGGRAAESLLGSLLDAGAGASGVSKEQLGKNFDTVVFCTNVTYTDGHFKGGERVGWHVPCRVRVAETDTRPHFQCDRPKRSVSASNSKRPARRMAPSQPVVPRRQSPRASLDRTRRKHRARSRKEAGPRRGESPPRWRGHGGGRAAGCAGYGLGGASRRVDEFSWTGQHTVVVPLRRSAPVLTQLLTHALDANDICHYLTEELRRARRWRGCGLRWAWIRQDIKTCRRVFMDWTTHCRCASAPFCLCSYPRPFTCTRHQ